MTVETFLGRLVVVRIDDERSGRAGPLGVLRQVDRLGGRVGAGAGDDPDPPVRRLDDDLHDPAMRIFRDVKWQPKRGRDGAKNLNTGGP